MKSQKQLNRHGMALGYSVLVVTLHTVLFSVWITVNLGWTRIKPFDPYPFSVMTHIVTIEALCAAVFVIGLQYRWLRDTRQQQTQKPNDLLAQYETERVRRKIETIAHHLQVGEQQDHEVCGTITPAYRGPR